MQAMDDKLAEYVLRKDFEHVRDFADKSVA